MFSKSMENVPSISVPCVLITLDWKQIAIKNFQQFQKDFLKTNQWNEITQWQYLSRNIMADKFWEIYC